MPTWRNIADVPGATFTVHKTNGGSDRATPSVNLVAGHFLSTYTGGDLGFNFVTVSLDDPGALILPCNVRVSLTEKIATTGGFAGDGLLSAGESAGVAMDESASLASPQTYTDEGVLAELDSLISFHFSASGEYFESLDFTIEVDGDIVASSFWTNFANCVEL